MTKQEAQIEIENLTVQLQKIFTRLLNLNQLLSHDEICQFYDMRMGTKKSNKKYSKQIAGKIHSQKELFAELAQKLTRLIYEFGIDEGNEIPW